MRYSPRKACLVGCLDCSCGSIVERRECPVRDCALWPFRQPGKPDFHNAIFPPKFWPKPGKPMSEERKAVVKARFAAHRAKK
jgi:hypothetical protein